MSSPTEREHHRATGRASAKRKTLARLPTTGINHETLRQWLRQDEADHGSRSDRLASAEREELAALRKENREPRRANEILKAASVFFARELDQPRPR